jgi:hypothetical protein
MIVAVEQFGRALSVLGGDLASWVAGMDSAAGRKCTYAAGLGWAGVEMAIGRAMDLLSVVWLNHIHVNQRVSLYSDTIGDTAEVSKSGFQTGGEGVGAADCAICVYPFGWTKFIHIASAFGVLAFQEQRLTELLDRPGLKLQKKRKGAAA